MMLPKIIGSETEYGLVVQNDPEFDSIATALLLVNSYNADQSLELLWDYDQEDPLVDARGFELDDDDYDVLSPQENMAINKILPNGARYYVDHAHPEFCTPECSNVLDLIRYEKAGERIVHLSLRGANQLLPPGRSIMVYKNNSDQKGNSYGYHENYLLDRHLPFQTIVDQMTPFFVSRQVMCGAGKVGAENGTDPVDYQISQRADFFETEVALDTMVKRPIINTRDEPHADREKYRRLHVIVGDANLSEYTIYLRNGATAIVLAMIEDGAITKNLALRDPVRAIKEISHDASCKHEFPLDDGKRRNAVEIQAEYLEMALAYTAKQSLDPITKDVLTKWQHAIEALRRDPMELDEKIDWVMKKAMIERFMERKSLDWNSPQVELLDLQYHDLRPEKGLYYLLERQGRAERIVADAEILAAIHTPPADTRAYFRGECLKKYGAAVFGVNWDSISFGVDSEPIKRILMAEPLKGTKAHVEELLDSSPTAADLVRNLRA